MVRRHRSGKSLRELRDEVAAAEAMGLNPTPPKASRTREPSPAPLKNKPAVGARQRLVWAVCDLGGRTVMTFAYAEKEAAEAHAAALKAKGKGAHFVRSIKEPIGPED
jgi:hypothetical protein